MSRWIDETVAAINQVKGGMDAAHFKLPDAHVPAELWQAILELLQEAPDYMECHHGCKGETGDCDCGLDAWHRRLDELGR